VHDDLEEDADPGVQERQLFNFALGAQAVQFRARSPGCSISHSELQPFRFTPGTRNPEPRPFSSGRVNPGRSAPRPGRSAQDVILPVHGRSADRRAGAPSSPVSPGARPVSGLASDGR
jgi:hypothetical protein